MTNYWDERTLLIYGLLGGYTRLSHEEINQVFNSLANIKGNVRFCISLLADLEEKQKIRVGIWLDLKKCRGQLDELPETEERNELIGKVQDLADWEIDGSSVLRGSIADLLEWEQIVTEELHGCLEFGIEVLAKKWLQGLVQDYLELFRQNELFTPTTGTYRSYHQQYLTLTEYLEKVTPSKKLYSPLLPEKLRFPELLYDLVDKDKLAIEGFDDLAKSVAVSDFTFGAVVNTGINGAKLKKSQRLSGKDVALEANSYDAANGILTILGTQINIIKQKNMKGAKREKKPAQLMRALFSPNTFPDAVAIRRVYPIDLRATKDQKYPRSVVNRASSLVSDINAIIQDTFELKGVIKSDDWKFYIDDRYLKK
jgi:hypothetical protein